MANDKVYTKLILQQTIKRDLSNLLESEVSVTLYNPNFYYPNSRFEIVPLLKTSLDYSKVITNIYTETPLLLQTYNGTNKSVQVYSDIIRSNCKITHQPDWGSVYIRYISSELCITNLSLLSYLISFRKENHFHELVCLMIFKRIYDLISPKLLQVGCYYTRRGGIDINPFRTNEKDYKILWDLYHYKLPRQ